MSGEEFGPWNPGIESALPRRLLPLVTLYRPENVFGGPAEALELADLTGLPAEELVAFRPRRLVLHELLVRVTADLSVPDGARLEDLGINFRAMTSTLLARYIEPHMAQLERAYALLEREVAALAAAGFAAAFAARSIDGLEARASGETAPVARAALRAVARVAGMVCARHGRLWGEPALLAKVATRLACNEHGSVALGRLIEPFVAEAVRAEGYALLPAQRQPVVMNTKGASASGKSSMRPLQKALAGEIGAAWSDFALISPDIWRKQLLDYGALGEAYKYAGSFTGQELRMVDHKLDRYMAAKAERGGMSHLLIDRFRFDSFAPASDEAGSNLLTRFGHFLYLFFMITPPHATVERSWRRGLEVGRYKAVDDLLAHNVEAYTGMPELFFTWALRGDKWVHYEFLDNGVPAGERPLTVAFGLNGELNVLDAKGMLDIERYARINVGASCAAEVYPGGEAAAPGRNAGFLVQCAHRLRALNFAERDTGLIYARIEAGALAWTDPPALERALADPETRAGVLAVAPGALGAGVRRSSQLLAGGRTHTLGRWRTA
ncbi:MAG TPA: hypothetical protein VKP89_09945 [Burkholderiales bacterium]|nr:hypothetical protein [Burkholderiales bacterium]